ncbi:MULTISPECIES: hypothetical protein [Mycobacteroides]|jgi:hypothetical protein|uniref:Uncharacterized protein n=2 Tax=Mycobacteroides TaxID=670516 RepID=A0ABR5LTJ0_9MYCO|nr:MULTISPECIES: hypothetical protein [Mycobacteroides]KPG34329.1 hypothetical protein AN912_11365 [Mycobacteroides immunogenum]ORB55272.1 hypothetical protein BST43_15505 [Mycobacteroides saopaulense]SKN57891.1 Uncharacterised protein [Mycobacteroides abscessus subsp. massiliense]SKR65901.1 Uncharacterised protein [Mycobacteroides abscessus subsp. abscessus]SLH52886.1 Uncharacterised protein [Mycobacteroides abscessus subsp. massiliense]
MDDKATVVTAVVLPVVTLLSGWALAAWRGSRHRTWEALSKDLELADKLSAVGLAAHALWLRQSVAVRLKGRAMADSRPRSDLLNGFIGCFFIAAGVGAFWFVGMMARQRDTVGVIIGIAMVIVMVGSGWALAYFSFKKDYRVPGLSDFFLQGNTEAVMGLRGQLKRLHAASAELPDAIPEPEATPQPEAEPGPAPASQEQGSR